MLQEEFKFKAQFGSAIIDAKISVYWTDTYYLFLDNALTGILSYRNNCWSFAASGNQDYNSDDLLVLAEIIQTNLKP
ncbi:hypothetical protein [Pedobacter aquatilis]|uniref:hypothetical protein n=1 Tax=Pedobacter aquatilis TaxID=351343 RepID=UPI0029304A29|nr:hypothetical protein [Pedobacter aquatilis]